MIAILSWIVFGLVVGIIAKLLMPGNDPGGFIVTVLLGIAGALVGGFIGRAFGFYGPNEAAGYLMSISCSRSIERSRGAAREVRCPVVCIRVLRAGARAPSRVRSESACLRAVTDG